MKSVFLIILFGFSSLVFSLENVTDKIVNLHPNKTCWCILAGSVDYEIVSKQKSNKIDGKDVIAFYKKNGFPTKFNSTILEPIEDGVICFGAIDKQVKGSKITQGNKKDCVNWSSRFGKNIIIKDVQTCIKDVSTRYPDGIIRESSGREKYSTWDSDFFIHTFLNCKDFQGEATEEDLTEVSANN
jgi:hypothetical protein